MTKLTLERRTSALTGTSQQILEHIQNLEAREMQLQEVSVQHNLLKIDKDACDLENKNLKKQLENSQKEIMELKQKVNFWKNATRGTGQDLWDEDLTIKVFENMFNIQPIKRLRNKKKG